MTNLLSALSIIVLVLIVGIVVFAAVKILIRSARNDNAPLLSADVRVVAKRQETGGGYFATFEITTGNQMEFEVNAEESGMLAEGDEGKLTFQGMRFVSFAQEFPLPPEE
jgi:flagellar biosynthesis/type III secretory pathway M-ring protein FliF/YscJ